jgi:hypothetical protein
MWHEAFLFFPTPRQAAPSNEANVQWSAAQKETASRSDMGCNPDEVIPVLSVVGGLFLAVGGSLLVAIHTEDWKVEKEKAQGCDGAADETVTDDNRAPPAEPAASRPGCQSSGSDGGSGRGGAASALLRCTARVSSMPLRRCKVPPKYLPWITTFLYTAIGVLIILLGITQCNETTTPDPTMPPSLAPAQAAMRAWQMRQVLNGDTLQGYHYFGYSVDVNRNGSAIAIGANPSEGSQSSVEVFYDASGSWRRLGNPIRTPEGAADSVFLSDDASSLAVFNSRFGGAVRVFALSDGASWEERHTWNPSNLPTEEGRSVIGIESLHVAPDFSYMAAVIKADAFEEPLVQVNEVRGAYVKSFFGASACAISRSGLRLITATAGIDSAATIYRNDNGFWWTDAKLVGYGTNVAISGDGDVVAAANSSGSGSMVVWSANQISKFEQIGDTIAGNVQMWSVFGRGGIAMSDDGRIVGAGGKVGNVNPNSWFTTLWFDGDTQHWKPLDSVFDPNTDEFPCAISGDGLTLCCGSPNDLQGGFDAGLVRIYHLERRQE